jgi:hypothetical protein
VSPRRVDTPKESREQCLAQALDYEWLAENAPDAAAAARAWDQARLWRSRALVAEAAETGLTSPDQGLGSGRCSKN